MSESDRAKPVAAACSERRAQRRRSGASGGRAAPTRADRWNGRARRATVGPATAATSAAGSRCRSRRPADRLRPSEGLVAAAADGADPRAGAVLEFQGRRRARNRRRADHQRLQHRERHLRADAVRRARRAGQGAVGRPRRLHPHRRRRRHRRADAAVRAVPAAAVGVLRRHRHHSRQPERAAPARIRLSALLPMPFDRRLLG